MSVLLTDTEAQPIICALKEFYTEKFLFDNIAPTISLDDAQKELDKSPKFKLMFKNEISNDDWQARENDHAWLGGSNLKNFILSEQKKLHPDQSDEAIQQNLQNEFDQLHLKWYHVNYDNRCPIDFLGNPKTPYNQLKLYLDDNIVIVGTEKDRSVSMGEIMCDPNYVRPLSFLIFAAHAYGAGKPSHYNQADFHQCLLNVKRNDMIYEALGGQQVKFIALMETTRTVLFKKLIDTHAADIAPSVELARKKLKEDKNLIFKLAEQYKLIPNADIMIKYHNLRDALAHPFQINDCSETGDPKQIIHDFENLLTMAMGKHHFTVHVVNQSMSTEDFIKQRHKQTGKTITLLNESAMQISPDVTSSYQQIKDIDLIEAMMSQMSFATSNPKKLNRKLKLAQMTQAGLLTSDQTSDLERYILNRNHLGHASATEATFADIEKNRKNLKKLADQLAKEIIKECRSKTR